MFGGKNFINKPVRVEDMLKLVSEFAFDKQQAFERFVHVRVADTLRNKYASDFVKRTLTPFARASSALLREIIFEALAELASET